MKTPLKLADAELLMVSPPISDVVRIAGAGAANRGDLLFVRAILASSAYRSPASSSETAIYSLDPCTVFRLFTTMGANRNALALAKYRSHALLQMQMSLVEKIQLAISSSLHDEMGIDDYYHVSVIARML